MKVNGYSTLGTLVTVCPQGNVSGDTGLGFEVMGIQMGLRDDEEGSVQWAGIYFLLDRFDLSSLVFDPRVHSLNIQKETG